MNLLEIDFRDFARRDFIYDASRSLYRGCKFIGGRRGGGWLINATQLTQLG